MATQQCEALKSSLNLEMAFNGYDPIMSSVLEQMDQGRKSTIFTPWQRESICTEKKEDVINSFVDIVQRGRCNLDLIEVIVRNYEAYKNLSTGAISFVTEGDATTTLGTTQFSFRDKAGYGDLNSPNALLIRDFFDQHPTGEVRFVHANCVTHTVRILPFQELVFTPAFLTAVQALDEAATGTNSGTRRNVFGQFFEYYGTHFARTTHFGYAAHFGKLFETQAKTPTEEYARHRCMLESARETLILRNGCECKATSEHFSRVVADKCNEEEVDVDVLVTETGSVSSSGLSGGDLAPNESPKPVAYILEKISTLFEETRISSQTTDTSQIRLNSTELSSSFEEYLAYYIQDVIAKTEARSTDGRPRTRSLTPRIANNIADSPEAGIESSSIMNEGIIIVGGEPYSTVKSFALFTPAPPPYPVHVHDNTLSIVNNVLFSCGGDGSNAKVCWYIDIATQNTWQSFAIPWELDNSTSVVVKDEIWCFVRSKLRIIDTTNPATNSREIELSFRFTTYVGAVTHDSKIFVIGAGPRKNEVRVNTDNTRPHQWDLFAILHHGRHRSGCIVYRSHIYVTGGRGVNRNLLSSVEVIHVRTGTVRTLSPLGGVRGYHQMAIVHGRPAVLGGFNGTAMDTIETYDVLKNEWEILDQKLSEPRRQFGLAQYLP